MTIKESLAFIQGELQKLADRDYIKPDGNAIFQGAKQELDGVIRTYVEPSSVPPTVTYMAMTEAQVEEVITRMKDNDDANALELATIINGVGSALETSTNDARANENLILEAVNTTRTEVLAAVNTPAA